MNLPAPITLNPPSITRPSGEVIQQPPITISRLEVTTIDSPASRICHARIHPCPFPLVLWSGDAYDAAGDYTQSQADARVMELLGSDVKAGLEGLFVPPSRG